LEEQQWSTYHSPLVIAETIIIVDDCATTMTAAFSFFDIILHFKWLIRTIAFWQLLE
jgi:hypothetical protein